MIDVTHSLIIIAICALVTAGIRFLPFLIFPSAERTPKALDYLGGVLPGAIMGMLFIYCVKSVDLFHWPCGIPEGISIALVVASYLWKRNTLLSIGAGTVVYMVLVQMVFV